MLAVAVSALFAGEAQAQLFMKKTFEGKMPQENYLAGAVPEENGRVVFTKTIALPAGMSKEEAIGRLQQWASFRYLPNTEQGKWRDDNYFKNLDYARVLQSDILAGVIECQAHEEMVFTNKTLAKDYAEVNYLLSLAVDASSVTVTMSNIIYTYSLTEVPERIAAEDWITDAEAISKNGTLYKGSARFRVKTVDLFNELAKEVEDALK